LAAKQVGKSLQTVQLDLVQLVPQEVFTQVPLHLPVLLQLAGGGVGHSTVVHPLAVHVVYVQLKVVLHVGNSLQTLQLDLVQFVPQDVLLHLGVHLPVLLQLAGGGGGQAAVVHPLEVHVLYVHLKVVLHVGNLPQTLQFDCVQFVPQELLEHEGVHLPVLLQLAGGGGGQAVVLHPLAVQIHWVQVVLRSQKGNSLHRVQLVWVQLVPQELLVQAGVHLPVFLQSAGAGQGTVRQPFLSQVVWVHWKVLVHVG
jgi:uncharacterized spore protein YtfJ